MTLTIVGSVLVLFLFLTLYFVNFSTHQKRLHKIKIISVSFLFVLILLTGCSTPSATDDIMEEPEETIIENKPSVKNKENESVDQTETNQVEADDKEKSNENQHESTGVTLIPAKVIHVTDGDTIKVQLQDGTEEKIRMILVDTPETVHPSKPVEPFGPEASQFTKDTLSNAEIDLELGIEERDRYGRLLAYIYLKDGTMYNKLLLEKGLARVSVFPPNTKYLDEFKAIEQEAKNQKLGIWSIEDYQSSNSAPDTNNQSETSTIPNQSNPSGPCTIKGNINSRGEKIYHMEGQQFYEKTNPEEIFCSEEEAQAAGYRKSMR